MFLFFFLLLLLFVYQCVVGQVGVTELFWRKDPRILKQNQMGDEKKQIKMMVVLGSPREDGDSSCMIEHAIQGAREECMKQGIELVVKPVVSLFSKDIKVCGQCLRCTEGKTLPSCVIEDDMKQIMTDILDSNIIIHAMPVWYWTMPGLIKVYLERWSQLFRLPQLAIRDDAKAALRGLTMGAMACSGDPNHEAMCADALRPWQRFAEFVPGVGRCGLRLHRSVSQPRLPEALSQPRQNLRSALPEADALLHSFQQPPTPSPQVRLTQPPRQATGQSAETPRSKDPNRSAQRPSPLN